MYCDITLRSVGGGGVCSLCEEHLIGTSFMVTRKPTAFGKCGNVGSARKYFPCNKYRNECKSDRI